MSKVTTEEIVALYRELKRYHREHGHESRPSKGSCSQSTCVETKMGIRWLIQQMKLSSSALGHRAEYLRLKKDI